MVRFFSPVVTVGGRRAAGLVPRRKQNDPLLEEGWPPWRQGRPGNWFSGGFFKWRRRPGVAEAGAGRCWRLPRGVSAARQHESGGAAGKAAASAGTLAGAVVKLARQQVIT